jgi:hypothetical protein
MNGQAWNGQRRQGVWSRTTDIAYWCGVGTSLLLLGTTGLAWVLSYERPPSVLSRKGNAIYTLYAREGVAGLSMRVDRSPNRLTVTRYEWAGFVWHHARDKRWQPSGRGGHQSRPLFYWRVGLPLWLVTGLAMFWPAHMMLSVRHWRRRKRRRQGLCPGCGYDLRATVDHCPECGEAVPMEITKRSFTNVS